MIKLAYPTIYQEVIQKFAVNGDMYWQQGLPGHDGIDIKAPYHSKIYAAADGKVIEINQDQDERWGSHILIQHDNGYKTLYAYLSMIKVNIGDKIKQNQVIALSGDAKNRGYIHFGLYNDNLESLKFSEYKNGEMDPTPFMFYDKEKYIKKSLFNNNNKTKIGKNIYTSKNIILDVDQTSNLVLSYETPKEIIKKYQKSAFIVVIVDESITYDNIKPSNYLKSIRSQIDKCYDAGVRYFQIGKNSNTNHQGLNSAWSSPNEFSNWWLDVCSPIKDIYSEIKIGFPSLSLGKSIPNIRIDATQFLLESGEAMKFANWIAFEYVWKSRKELIALISENHLKKCEKIAPNKPRLITSYGHIDYLLKSNNNTHIYSEFEKWVIENKLADMLFKTNV